MEARGESVLIREFRDGDEAAFRKLNEEWILRHFVLERKDEEALADPRGSILDAGGRIFFAVTEAGPVGCCALLAMEPGEFEVAKMAVTESAQGLGVGRRLLTAVIEEARVAGVKRLYLETNRKLTPALRLYESCGFRHLAADQITDSPYARANVFMELWLQGSEGA
jgi:GNAT superfamily N-acetyltransferase